MIREANEMRYYIVDQNNPNGSLEVTQKEYEALFGDDTISPYVQAVYRGEITIDDVPIEHREAVQTVVSNKVSRWGIYDEAIDNEGAPYVYEETEKPIELQNLN